MTETSTVPPLPTADTTPPPGGRRPGPDDAPSPVRRVPSRLRICVTASREAMRLADLRFRAGTANFLEVLDAQRQLLAAETEEAQALLERRLALVNIYLALGGGWQGEP